MLKGFCGLNVSLVRDLVVTYAFDLFSDVTGFNIGWFSRFARNNAHVDRNMNFANCTMILCPNHGLTLQSSVRESLYAMIFQ